MFSLDEFPLLGIIGSKTLSFTPKALPAALLCRLTVSVSSVTNNLSLSCFQSTFYYGAQCLAVGLSGHPWRVLPESCTFQEIHYYHTPQIYLEGYWSIVDLPCCVNFGRTAKGLIYVYINMPFPILFSSGLSQHVDYLSMCCTVRSCLFILYKVVCLC